MTDSDSYLFFITHCYQLTQDQAVITELVNCPISQLKTWCFICKAKVNVVGIFMKTKYLTDTFSSIPLILLMLGRSISFWGCCLGPSTRKDCCH